MGLARFRSSRTACRVHQLVPVVWCSVNPRCRILFAFPLLLFATLAPASDAVAVNWNSAVLQGVRNSQIPTPIASRALAIIHTCMYDAWAAYDEKAVGTQLGGALRRPMIERTMANKEKAISYAGYRALVDLFPAYTDSVYKPLMKQLGYDPNDNSTDIETPAGIGNVTCAAVLEARHHDRSNQLGDLAQGPYSDWTHFRPVNMPRLIPLQFTSIHPIDPNRWGPLIYVDATGGLEAQMFTTAHWCYVTPFAMSSGDEFRSDVALPTYEQPEYRAQAEELVKLSANLSDRDKMLAEYWVGDENVKQAPERWNEFAEWISERDHHSLDDDVKMFFALNNALLDASIAAWDMKRTFDSVRPLTAIEMLFNGQKISAWGGPGKGTIQMDGSHWLPYQLATSPTPPSPEFVSGTSTYSAAAASILRSWAGSDRFGYSIPLSAGSSKIEPGSTPHEPLTFEWSTFSDAVEQAGRAQLYAGIHFRDSDRAGRELGVRVADKVWVRAQAYFNGTAGLTIPRRPTTK